MDKELIVFFINNYVFYIYGDIKVNLYPKYIIKIEYNYLFEYLI